MPTTESPAPETKADKLRNLASEVRDNPYAREAIANAFELIADAMTPCEDCGAPSLQDLPATLVPDATTGQAAA